MAGMLTAVQTALIAVLCCFMFVLKDSQRASLTGLVIIKISVVMAVLQGQGVSFAVFSILISGCGAAVFILYLAESDNKSESPVLRRDFVITGVFLLLVLVSSSGCSKKDIKMPEIYGAIDLKFIPSVILADDTSNGIYVGDERGRRVYLYDIKTKKPVKTIKTGLAPSGIIKGTHKIYISNKRSGSVTVYNTITGDSRDIKTGGTLVSAVCVSKDEGTLYAANTGSSTVSIIDLNDNSIIKKISTGKWPSDLCLSPDNKYLYVTSKYTNTVEIIDAERKHHLFTKVDTGISPVKIVPINKKELAILNEWEYAFNHQSAVVIFDSQEYALKSSIRVDGGINDGVLSKSKKYLFISSGLREKIIFVDLKKNEKIFEIHLKGGMPKALALSPDGKVLFAAAQGTKKIVMIRLNGLI